MHFSNDATKETDYLGRLINHNLDGNAISEPYTINGERYIVFFASRDIKKGEEITYDYKDN